MSIDFYPAILREWEKNVKAWESVVPMHGDPERLVNGGLGPKDEAGDGEPFEPNPEYIPFSSLNISHGNAIYILRLIGLNPDTTESSGNLPIQEVFKKANDALWTSTGRVIDYDQYVVERIFALREMARLGISRGATHIVWV